MADDSPLGVRLRRAILHERVANASWRARRNSDTLKVMIDAVDEVDRLIDELETHVTFPVTQPEIRSNGRRGRNKANESN